MLGLSVREGAAGGEGVRGFGRDGLERGPREHGLEEWQSGEGLVTEQGGVGGGGVPENQLGRFGYNVGCDQFSRAARPSRRGLRSPHGYASCTRCLEGRPPAAGAAFPAARTAWVRTWVHRVLPAQR